MVQHFRREWRDILQLIGRRTKQADGYLKAGQMLLFGKLSIDSDEDVELFLGERKQVAVLDS